MATKPGMEKPGMDKPQTDPPKTETPEEREAPQSSDSLHPKGERC